MREITSHKVNGVNDALRIQVLDEPGPGGACHWYSISTPAKPLKQELQQPHVQVDINFQDGPIGEAGVNGITHEAVLAILVDRLVAFQLGPYACVENAEALEHCRRAMQALHSRTLARAARGVEGTMQK